MPFKLQQPIIIGQLSKQHNPDIISEINDAIQNIPDIFKFPLQNLPIKIARRQSDIDVSATTCLARGYNGLTSEFSGAHYKRSGRISTPEIVIVQETVIEDGLYTPNPTPYHDLLHELGHAFDDWLWSGTHFSSDPDFIEAYEKDIVALLKKPTNEQIIEEQSYFISTVDHSLGRHDTQQNARDEVFAESFANILAGFGASSNIVKSKNHKKIFSNCYKHMEKRILTFAPDTPLYPDYKNRYKRVDKIQALKNAFGDAISNIKRAIKPSPKPKPHDVKKT